MSESKESFWRRLFRRHKDTKEDALSANFERFVEMARPTLAQTSEDFARATGAFVREALQQRRFETAAIALIARGRRAEALKVGKRAMAEGKYEQALKIFTRIGDPVMIGEAAEAAARNCLEKGGSKKVAAQRLHLAIDCLARRQTSSNEQKVFVLKKVSGLAQDLAKVLAEMGDHRAAGDTLVYAAKVHRLLAPFAQDLDLFASDPRLFQTVPQKVKDLATAAREQYRLHVEKKRLAPESPEGSLIIEKLRDVNELLKEQ